VSFPSSSGYDGLEGLSPVIFTGPWAPEVCPIRRDDGPNQNLSKAGGTVSAASEVGPSAG
jgi:hypothetical protein